ncbi:LytTR family DNA-binding domain-containing protein [Pricia sp. S334]|uniref:LytTR family DNA-binding domain-containing protein n=1 Tax=Pricia mediterranea TaxID=3076079 RepID=A0ABU3L5V3_9FLAO|nr:LytTR family DNA-binding domain-containing protein [Pricia sp. S334]MDT7829121.1 LytTR family DNA-binding domain-containing protein [Pricia sp. S334]
MNSGVTLFMILCLLPLAQLAAQQEQSVRSQIKSLKRFDLDALELVDRNDDLSVAGSALQKRLAYLKNGDLTQIEPTADQMARMNHTDKVLYNIHQGDYFFNKVSPIDSLAYKHYLNALDLSKKRNDTLLINKALQRINSYFLKNFNDKKLYTKYVSELSKYAQDSIDEFWKRYYRLVYDMSYSGFSESEFRDLEDRFLGLVVDTPAHSYFRSVMYHMTGIFYTYPGGDSAKSRKYFELALQSYNDHEYYSFKRKIRTAIALSIMDYNDGNYKEAIEKLEQTLKNDNVKTDYELKYLIYDWLSKAHEKMGKPTESNAYLKLKISALDSVKYYAFAEKIRDIDVKYDVKNKEIAIQELEDKNSELQNNILTLLPFLGIAAVILVLLFFLYRRYRKKSTVLESEKSETLQKLDELKNIVIKNHIVLKDKTKVYISDLMYIKSDDHYLNIHTSDDKSHFVRGKLKKIREELPPNFIQCHRSYIVNRNFVKRINNKSLTLLDKSEIPLSRSYRDEF